LDNLLPTYCNKCNWVGTGKDEREICPNCASKTSPNPKVKTSKSSKTKPTPRKSQPKRDDSYTYFADLPVEPIPPKGTVERYQYRMRQADSLQDFGKNMFSTGCGCVGVIFFGIILLFGILLLFGIGSADF